MEAGGYERVQTSLRLLIIISGLDSNDPVVTIWVLLSIYPIVVVSGYRK